MELINDMNSTTLKTMINQSINQKCIKSNYYSGDVVGQLSVKSLIIKISKGGILFSFEHIVN